LALFLAGPLDVLATFAAAIFGAHFLLNYWYLAGRGFLADVEPVEPAEGWPELAILVAARNEGAHIERAVGSLLTLDYPRLRVIAVNDRSTDNTGTVLERLAAKDQRLTVQTVTHLPLGWLGKTHALHGAAAASADAKWLLFTDADVEFKSDALRRAVVAAMAAQADHVTAYPEMRYKTPMEALFLAFFGLGLALQMPTWAVEWRRSRAYLGIGAFNLVSRRAFEQVAGFSHLKLAVDDDMRLGEALKAHGYRTRIVYGRGAMALEWQPDALGYIRGLEKNAFASLEFSLGRAAAVLGGLALIGIVPFVAVIFGGMLARAAGLVAIAATTGLVALGRRNSGIPALYSLGAPVAAGMLAFALVASVAKTCRRGGIVWRDTFYSLAVLKEHVRARRTWIAEARRTSAQNHPNGLS